MYIIQILPLCSINGVTGDGWQLIELLRCPGQPFLSGSFWWGLTQFSEERETINSGYIQDITYKHSRLVGQSRKQCAQDYLYIK